MDSLIRFRDVCFSYTPTRPVLDGACFDLRAGERVGLIGTNGCGKTTLLHLIVGLLQPCGGEIVAFGSARQRERDFLEVRRRAGLLFQDADDQLFCPTVAEDVAFGPVNLGYDREQIHAVVHETLAWLGMDGFEDTLDHLGGILPHEGEVGALEIEELFAGHQEYPHGVHIVPGVITVEHDVTGFHTAVESNGPSPEYLDVLEAANREFIGVGGKVRQIRFRSGAAHLKFH